VGSSEEKALPMEGDGEDDIFGVGWVGEGRGGDGDGDGDGDWLKI
jgi:hypothetical protein